MRTVTQNGQRAGDAANHHRGEVLIQIYSHKGDIDSFVVTDPMKIKGSSRLKETFEREIGAEFDESKIRRALYRPFTEKQVFFDARADKNSIRAIILVSTRPNPSVVRYTQLDNNHRFRSAEQIPESNVVIPLK